MKITRNGAVTALPSCSGGGPLVSHLDRFATLLASEGYAATTIHVKCTLVAKLSRWLKRHKSRWQSWISSGSGNFTWSLPSQCRATRGRRDDATTSLVFTRDRLRSGKVTTDRSDAMGKLTRDFSYSSGRNAASGRRR